MATTISIALLALAIIGNSISIWHVSKKKEYSGGFISDGPMRNSESYKLGNQINKLENKLKDAQPLIDKYKKERKRQHWKQYNDWNFYTKARYFGNEEYVCSECHSEDLEINTDYKRYTSKESYYLEDCIDYPETAECKCNTCGEVINKWEFKEEK